MRRLVSITLIILLVVGLTACKKEDNFELGDSVSSESTVEKASSTSEDFSDEANGLILNDNRVTEESTTRDDIEAANGLVLREGLAESSAEGQSESSPAKPSQGSLALVEDYMITVNGDTIGWLEIDGAVSEPVVFYPNDENKYYYRRDVYKRDSQLGSLYADFRCKFSNGVREGLSRNTVIYGHNLDDNAYGKMFAALKRFEDVNYAGKTPYIKLYLQREELMFEIFAVTYTTSDVAYNHPDYKDSVMALITSDAIKSSLYNYGVGVDTTDKILTLSTCTYSVPDIGKVEYPSKHRFVVMARLVGKGETLKQKTAFAS